MILHIQNTNVPFNEKVRVALSLSGESTVIGGFPAQREINAENISI